MRQQTLVDNGFERFRTRRETFLLEVDEIIPRYDLCKVIEPFYPKLKNRTQSKVRAKVEHPFLVLKRISGFNKVRYRRIIVALVVVFAFVPLTTQAQEPVLLEPLTKSEEAVARAENHYFIREATFAAKRHRLVKVDIDLLETRGEIVIPLFDGEKMVVDFKDIKIDKVGGGFRWDGRLVQDKFTEGLFLDHLPVSNVDAAGLIFESLTEVTIIVDLYERDRKSGANLIPVTTFADAMSPNKPDRYAQRHSNANPDNILGVTATLYPQIIPGEYRLQMLGMGGPYHILYEVDPSRELIAENDVVEPDGSVADAFPSASENEKRKYHTLQQEIDAFRESQGENPHDALYRQKMKEKGMLK